MSKYYPLCEYLSKCEHTHIELTFKEIEQIIGFQLPKSANSYSAWWANSGHTHSSIWTDAGYIVETLNLSAKKVSFSKNMILKLPKTNKKNTAVRKETIISVKPVLLQDNADIINIHGYDFQFLQRILPDCDTDGCIIKFFPQERYDNKDNLPLLDNGNGAFCHFSIDVSSCAGVYLWVVDKEIIYIGETENLHHRFNMGYGNISPRNCYKGGQSTNCKMNKLVLELYEQGKNIDLYFYETANYKVVERELLKRINTPYNVKDNR